MDERSKVKDPSIYFRDTLNDVVSVEKHILAINEIINVDLLGLLVKNQMLITLS